MKSKKVRGSKKSSKPGRGKSAKPKLVKFLVRFESEMELTLDQRVIDAVNDEWREQMYPLHTPEQIAEHIAYNMVVNDLQLTSMDGFADQKNEYAEIQGEYDWDIEARNAEAVLTIHQQRQRVLDDIRGKKKA